MLVCDGGRTSLAPPGADGASEARTSFAADAIAGYLGEMNPQLSERQLRRIATAVLRYSEKYDLDPSLVVAVITAESSARPWVRSSKGAVGLMQVMPYMMGSLPVAGNLTSIESNIEVGCMILADNIRRLGENRGILAYFWGNDVRGVAYLERVKRARAAFLRHAAS
jgi:soluble lytic murein transglycosylase-like protein